MLIEQNMGAEMNNIDLLKARDKVLETDPDDADAVNKTIAEIEPLVNALNRYLENEAAFWERAFMQILMSAIPKFYTGDKGGSLEE